MWGSGKILLGLPVPLAMIAVYFAKDGRVHAEELTEEQVRDRLERDYWEGAHPVAHPYFVGRQELRPQLVLIEGAIVTPIYGQDAGTSEYEVVGFRCGFPSDLRSV